MTTLADIAEKDWAVSVEGVPGISLRLTDSGGMEKTLHSVLQRIFGLYDDAEEAEEDCAEAYKCWTCGASYETGRAIEFLRHIKVCCKGPSSETGDLNGR
jgi:hypothetical protein